MTSPKSPATGLDTPVLLVALPQVQDQFFHKSVVLLIHHSDEGSVGLIVNRPTEIEIGEILADMEMEWGGEGRAFTWFGGPVQPQVGTVLYAPESDGDRAGIQASLAVTSGVSLTQHLGDLGLLADEPPNRFRLLLGYAGWDEGQLMEEILRNDWLTVPVDPELIFAGDPESAWAGALLSVGVNPATLPSWTTGDQGGGAN